MGKDKEKKVKAEDDEKAAKKAAKKLKKEQESAGTSAEDEKAAKKAAKKAKREAEAAAEGEPVKKKKKSEDDDDKPKLSKEEKAAKKAKKAAKEAAANGTAADFAPPADVAAPAPAPAADEEGNRLFVGNLSFKMTEEWLKEIFQPAGTITGEIDWLMHQDTGRWKGAIFCTMASAAEANAAVAQLNGKEVEGRPMKVEVATSKKPASGAKAFNNEPGEPSESVFLGNLSWTVDEESTRKLFADCGEILKLKWLEKDGEFRGMAFIDFETVEAATKAVALSGTDLCGRPIRINFSKPREKPAGGDKWGGGGGGGGAWGGAAKTSRPSKPTGDKPDGCVELFCGNLPWSVDESMITNFFAKVGATVTGTRWLNDKVSGEFKGVGFVTFESTGDVDKAVGLGGENLEGRPIRLDYAGKSPAKKEGAWQGNSW